MRKFEYRYKIDEENRTVVAISSFAKKVVVGVARCSPSDTFDVEKGKQLAAARCNLKIAEKRLKRAIACADEAEEQAELWCARAAQMSEYEVESTEAFERAFAELKSLEKTFCDD
jgi:hypothetical protein